MVRYDTRYGPSSVPPLLPCNRNFVEIQQRNSPYARLAYFTIFCFAKLPRYRLSCESGAVLSMLQIRRRSYRRRSSPPSRKKYQLLFPQPWLEGRILVRDLIKRWNCSRFGSVKLKGGFSTVKMLLLCNWLWLCKMESRWRHKGY